MIMVKKSYTAVKIISILCLTICVLIVVSYLASSVPARNRHTNHDTPADKAPQKQGKVPSVPKKEIQANEKQESARMQMKDAATNSNPYFTKKNISIGIIALMLLCAAVVLKRQRVANNEALLKPKSPIVFKSKDKFTGNDNNQSSLSPIGENDEHYPEIPSSNAQWSQGLLWLRLR